MKKLKRSITILVCLILFTSCTNKNKEVNFNYTTLPLEKVGLSYQNRAIQKLIIKTDSIISKENLKNLSTNYFRDNTLNIYNEFTLFIYFSSMNSNAGAYCLAEFNKDGVLNQFSINKSSLIGTKWELEKDNN
jgi:hypothetical protein